MSLTRRPPPAAALVLTLLVLCTAAAAEPRAIRLRFFAEDPRATAAQLAREGFDVAHADRREGTVDVMGDEAVADRLRAMGFDPRPADTPAPAALSDYLTPDEIASRLAQVESSHPALAKRIAYATDHEGRTAWALKISDHVALDEDEPAVLFVAQHHAREVMTSEVAMDIVDQLVTGYGVDPEITHWVDSAEIFVVPTHNPDGASYVFTTDSVWRKNRRNNGDGTYGVDLNRNYAFQWGACGGSSSAPGDDLYRGPAAGSEPTTAGLVALARQHRPVFYVTYHTYGPYALHPYGCNGALTNPPDFRTLREMTSEVSALMEADVPGTWFEFGTPWEVLYAVDGDMDSWFYGAIGSFGLTFELSDGNQGFQPDYATWRDSTVERARAGWRYYLSRLDGPRITGHVTDACTGLPLPAATIGLAEQSFTNGETPRTPAPGLARFDWPVLPGTYTLQTSAAGYRAQSWPVDVAFAPADRPVALVPAGRQGAAVSGARVSDALGDGDGQVDPGETIELFLTAYATGESVGGLTATVTSADPSVTVLDDAASFGSLAAGERREAADAVRIRVSAGAEDDLPVVLHVAFSASSPLCAAGHDLPVRVTTGVPGTVAVHETLDANPFWAIDNGGTTQGWEFGTPAAGVGGAPPTAYTGQNVYATNLGGNYLPSASYSLTAGPYDLTGLRHAELRFARWLQSEPGFDLATVEARSGADGTWRTVWKGFGRDAAWSPLRYDVGDVADGSPEFYVRFSLSSDAVDQRRGFYLDDLQIVGERVPIPGAHVGFVSARVDDSDPAYANGNGRLDAGETARLALTVRNAGTAAAHAVSGVVTAVTPGVTVHDAVVDFPDLAAGASGDSAAPHATVSASSSCGDAITLRLASRWSDGGHREDTLVVPVGQTVDTTLLSDDFETDLGWISGGAAASGAFVRGDPNGCTSSSLGPIRPEDDTTPPPGHLCWITGNPPPSSTCPPSGGDVSRGEVWIESPPVDASGDGRLLLDFSRWLSFTGTSFMGTILYRAEVSGDDGVTWAVADSGSYHAPYWSTQHLELTGLVPPSDRTRVRFFIVERLSKGSASSVLAIDDVSIVRRHGVCAPWDATETLPPNTVGNSLRASRSGPDLVLTWTAPSADATHDPARFYPVVRSASASGGGTEAGTPTGTSWRDPGALDWDAGTAYYLVKARNAAGDSTEPAP